LTLLRQRPQRGRSIRQGVTIPETENFCRRSNATESAGITAMGDEGETPR
jgi:hypothetical protein